MAVAQEVEMSDMPGSSPQREDVNSVADGDEDEFEEITSDEVDRVLDLLEQLIESVDSENIRFHLEEAASSIYSLIYEDDDLADAA
jgi:hypothetical protein